ncbi:unnamed protein product [Closterium sp. NIES-53]
MWGDYFKLPDGWTPAQGQEGRGEGGGRGRGRGGHGSRGGGAASMKSAGNESESRDDRFPGQFFFVSTQAPAGPEKDEGFEEPAAVGKVTLHSLDYWVIDSGATCSMTPRADLLTELEPSPVKHVTSALGQRAEVKSMGKAMFKGAEGKMVGLKNKWQIPVVPMPKERQVAASISTKGEAVGMVPMPKERQVAGSISTKGEAVGSGDGANGRAKEIKSKKCNIGVTSKLGEHEESGATAKKQHKDEENPKAAAEEEYGENMWGTIASAAFSYPTSATGECDWLTLHRRMGHVALPILQQLVKNEMVAGIRVKGELDEVLGCPTCMQAKFTRYPFSSSEATAKAPLDEVVMDVVGPLKLGAAGAEYFLTIVDGADGVEPGRLFLTAFSDASYASEPEDMTSVGGFIFYVGGGPTAWESKKQVDQALSSVESEYMALFCAVREIVWQRRLLAELGEEQQGPTPLYRDSQGAIALAKNPVLHGLTKHMRVKWHWTRSMVAAGEVELHYVKTIRQPADMMTKRLVEQQHWKCCKLVGMALN